jgi:hypothetical protein
MGGWSDGGEGDSLVHRVRHGIKGVRISPIAIVP